jgi:hypothetical protein
MKSTFIDEIKAGQHRTSKIQLAAQQAPTSAARRGDLSTRVGAYQDVG